MYFPDSRVPRDSKNKIVLTPSIKFIEVRFIRNEHRWIYSTYLAISEILSAKIYVKFLLKIIKFQYQKDRVNILTYIQDISF